MIACPSCDFAAADNFAFCPKCGTALAAPHRDSEERKVVTTLFCDLVGFTALCEAHDHENVDAMLRSYASCARGIVESHGGVVEKFIGDAVVAVFGFPRAHDDDAERAVRTGLRIAAEVPKLEWPGGTSPAVRVGINTGETYVHTGADPQSGETFLTGDAVNIAARLQSAAPPGGVVVGEYTYSLTGTAFVSQALEPLALKGKAEPVPAWLVTEPVGRTGLRTSGESATPFFGREEELTTLRAALHKAITRNRAQFVLLVGEPGIGKSRLVLEYAKLLDAEPGLVTWRQGRCLPYGERASLSAFAEILKAHAGILDSDDPASVAAKLEVVLPEGEDRPWLRQRLRPLLGLRSPGATQEESFAAWSLFLSGVASHGPTVLVFEDLHWADEQMLAFIGYLLAGGLQTPLLVVATARPELLQRDPQMFLDREDGSRLSLRPLTGRDAGRLVSALLDERIAADLRAPILARVGGNPLYAEEYVRLLLDRGLLARRRGVLRLQEGEDLPLPETVQAVLQARFDTLPTDCKAVLCDAAVFGESFWRDGVAVLAGCDPVGIESALGVLAERQLVRPATSSSLAGEAEYLFWHALARDVAYAQLPRRARADKHAAVARWIEEKGGDGGDELAAVLSHHYLSAHDLAKAVGDQGLATSLVDPTLDALRGAARHARNLDVPAVERYLSRALQLVHADDRRRLTLFAEWAMTVQDMGDSAKAVPALEEASAELVATGQPRLAAKTLIFLADAYDELGGDSLPCLQDAFGLLEGDGPSEESICALQHLAAASVNRGQTEQSLAYAERALAAAEALDLRAECSDDVLAAVLVRGAGRCQLGDSAGLDSISEAVEAALVGGYAIRLVIVHALVTLNVLGPGPAIPLIERYARLYRDRGLATFEGFADTLMVDARRAAGEWDEALAAYRRMEAELEAGALQMRTQLARVLTYRGEMQAAERMISGCLPLAREQGVPQHLADTLIAVAAVEVARDEEYARSCLDELSGLLDPAFAFFSVLDLPDMLRVAHAVGARVVAEDLTCWIPLGLPTQQCVRTYGEALLSEARGDHQAAASDFADAAARWQDFGMPYEEAQALLGQGRCMLALGRAPESTTPLGAAREIFDRLGAKPALEEVEGHLQQAAASG